MGEAESEKVRHRAARQRVGEYHEQRAARLLENVRDGFGRFDAGEIDVFELDELIHRYKRSARELWKFCSLRSESVAWAVDETRERGEEVDWWAAGEPRRSRSADGVRPASTHDGQAHSRPGATRARSAISGPC